MNYSLQTLLHERTRYAAGVGAVAFSAVLMALQFGLMLGLFTITSTPIDRTDSRNVWVGSKDVQSVDLGRPIPVSHIGRLGERPGVQPTEPFIAMFGQFQKPDGGTDLCFLLASSLEGDAAGAADVLTPEQRIALTEPFTIIMDDSDMKRMQMTAVNETAKINGKEVRLVGTVKGLKSLAAPWVFCSLPTARDLAGTLLPPDHTTYLLAKCDTEQRAKDLAKDLKTEFPEMTAMTAEDFSTSSRLYWLYRTKAGVAIGYAALLGLCVGVVVTAQTLYAATMASAREYATLFALGIPRWRVYISVLLQAMWVGIIGVLCAYPIVCLLAYLAELAGAKVLLRWEVLAGTAVVTLCTALFAGFVALRSVRTIEPMSLLR
ncbi:FtsX-like permease family protein [soil metagenome]